LLTYYASYKSYGFVPYTVTGIERKQKIDKTDLLRRKSIPFVFYTTTGNQQIIDSAYSKSNLQGFFKKEASVDAIRQQMKCILDYWYSPYHPFTAV
jgi:hypothetical protein